MGDESQDTLSTLLSVMQVNNRTRAGRSTQEEQSGHESRYHHFRGYCRNTLKEAETNSGTDWGQ